MRSKDDDVQERKFTWDKDDVEFEKSGNGKPLVPPSERAEAKRLLREAEKAGKSK